MSFTQLGLSAPLLHALKDKGYETPTPIQEKAIPEILDNNDVMAAAQTGTGKTAGFILPILQKLSDKPKVKGNHCYVLILTPTRELAAQVYESARDYGKHLHCTAAVVFGGVKINPQMLQLRKGVDILVATPGRLMDLHQQNAIRFDQVEILVLDEADRMLDMGFIRDIQKILALLPKKRQNLLFSATFSSEIRTLAKGILREPVEIDVAPRNTTAERVEQWIYPVDKTRKADLLSHLIRSENWEQVIVFSRTKHGANKLVTRLEHDNIKAMAIHGNKSQNQRTAALADFKAGKIKVLVATDIAARGIDIPQLPYVVNYDLPNISEDYVHRIGRTGRAGLGGKAISLVCADESEFLYNVEFLTQQNIPRQDIPGFEAQHKVPASTPVNEMKKPKKIKNPHGETRGSSTSGNRPARSFGATPQRNSAKPGGGKPAGGSPNNGNRGNTNSSPGNNNSRPQQRRQPRKATA
jgi:ATP-dependent RNA helicase RhlE